MHRHCTTQTVHGDVYHNVSHHVLPGYNTVHSNMYSWAAQQHMPISVSTEGAYHASPGLHTLYIPTHIRTQGAPLPSLPALPGIAPSWPSPVSPLGRHTEAAVVITRSREWVTGGVCEPQSLHQWARLPPCRPSSAFPWPPLVICKRLSVGSAESAYKWIITNVSNVYCGRAKRDL